jgi:hypothetical protein
MLVPDRRRHPVDRFSKAGPIEQERADVPELDARLGMIRDCADQGLQIGVERDDRSP